MNVRQARSVCDASHRTSEFVPREHLVSCLLVAELDGLLRGPSKDLCISIICALSIVDMQQVPSNLVCAHITHWAERDARAKRITQDRRLTKLLRAQRNEARRRPRRIRANAVVPRAQSPAPAAPKSRPSRSRIVRRRSPCRIHAPWERPLCGARSAKSDLRPSSRIARIARSSAHPVKATLAT